MSSKHSYTETIRLYEVETASYVTSTITKDNSPFAFILVSVLSLGFHRKILSAHLNFLDLSNHKSTILFDLLIVFAIIFTVFAFI